MVAIKANQFAGFLKSLPRELCAVLTYGPDAGLVAERATAAAQRFAARDEPPGEILRIEEADLEQDRDRIYLELQTVAMFGGAKVVRTTAGRRINAAFLKPLLEPGAIAGTLVVEAGNLRADDAVRKLFERAQVAAAIPCFADAAKDIEAIIRNTLSEAKLTIAPEAMQMLLGRLGADRALTRSELEKLVLYASGTKAIDEADVEAVVGDASELAIDAILFAVSGGDGRRAVVEFDRAVSSGNNAQMIIALTQRHFQRLHRVRAALDTGRSFDEAARALRPPLHFKTRSTVEAHCRNWDTASLDRALALIGRAAQRARLSGDLETTLTERLLLELATMAASRQPGATGFSSVSERPR